VASKLGGLKITNDDVLETCNRMKLLWAESCSRRPIVRRWGRPMPNGKEWASAPFGLPGNRSKHPRKRTQI